MKQLQHGPVAGRLRSEPGRQKKPHLDDPPDGRRIDRKVTGACVNGRDGDDARSIVGRLPDRAEHAPTGRAERAGRRVKELRRGKVRACNRAGVDAAPRDEDPAVGEERGGVGEAHRRHRSGRAEGTGRGIEQLG